MHGGEDPHDLELDDHHPFHQHVYPVSTIQVDVQVADPHGHLPLHHQSPLSQRRLETDLVRVLEQPGPEVTMDINRSADNVPRNPVVSSCRSSPIPFPP
jgi:hypothetical protein